MSCIVGKGSVVAVAALLQDPKISTYSPENYGGSEAASGRGELDNQWASQPIWDMLARGVGAGISGVWRVVLAGAMLAMWQGQVRAAPCPAGLVVREAGPGDLVCVTPESKQRAAADNARAPLRWVAGPFGPKTCAQGFVWRLAFDSDQTCVIPEVRTATLEENKGPRGDPKP